MSEPHPNPKLPGGGARPPRSPTALLALAGVLSLLVAAGSGLAIAGIRHVEQRVVKIQVGPECRGEECLRDLQPRPCMREACNFLILGSDSRESVPGEQQGGALGSASRIKGQRADTIILVQVDTPNDRTVVLSIPRDLLVEIPGHGTDRINTALEHGPNVMVQAVEHLTGLEINHYVQVDFVGFQKLVDALGGVPICVDRPMKDPLAGLSLPDAGCHVLDGDQALAFVRARHIEGDAIPDFSRISRQQQFMRAVFQRVLSAGAVFHYQEIVDAAPNLKVDSTLDLYALQDLSLELAELGQRKVQFRVVPATPVEGAGHVELIEPDATRLFRKIRNGGRLGDLGREEPLTPISPANVSVRVLDAESGGAARDVATFLRRAGFLVEVADGPADAERSVILARGSKEKEQKVVSRYLPSLPVDSDGDLASDVDVAVVVGGDFEGVDGL